MSGPIDPASPTRVAGLVTVSLLAMWGFFLSWPLYRHVSLNLLPPWAPDGCVPSGSVNSMWDGVHDLGVEWVRTPTSPVARLRATATCHPSLRYTITNPEPAEAIIVRGAWRGEQIRRGEYGYSVARVLFFVRDRQGRARWDLPHAAASFTGTRGWHTFERRFHPPPDAASWTFAVAHQGSGGVLECSRLEAVRAVRHPAATAVFVVWALWWLALAVRSFQSLQLRSRPNGWVLAAWAMLIWAGMWVPDSAIEWLHDRLRKWGEPSEPVIATVTRPPSATGASAHSSPSAPSVAPTLTPEVPKPSPWALWGLRLRRQLARLDLHKTGHLVLFAAFAWLAHRCFGFRLRTSSLSDRSTWWIGGGLLLFAVWAESLQWLTLTRRPHAFDIGWNLIGIALGLLFAEMRRAISPAVASPNPVAKG